MKLKYRDLYDMPIGFYIDMMIQLKDTPKDTLKYNLKKLSILYDTSVEEIESLDFFKLIELLSTLDFLNIKINENNRLNDLEFDETYTIEYNPFNFTVQRYMDIELFIERKDEYERDLYLFCTILKNGDYHSGKLLSLINEVREIPVQVFYDCISFFLYNWISFEKTIHISTKMPTTITMEENLEATLILLSMIHI